MINGPRQAVAIAIVTDVYCDDPCAERAEIAEQFQRQLESVVNEPLNVEVKATGRGIHEVKDVIVDVLILDYGAAQFGATEMGRWQSRDARKWAEDHPGKILLLWTSFTKQLYETEWSQYDNLPNVIYRWEEPPLEADDDLMDHAFAAIAVWLGLIEDK